MPSMMSAWFGECGLVILAALGVIVFGLFSNAHPYQNVGDGGEGHEPKEAFIGTRVEDLGGPGSRRFVLAASGSFRVCTIQRKFT